MTAHPRPSGENAKVTCQCGWSGIRARTTTQPCPNCDAAINWLPVQAKRRGYQRQHEANKAAENLAEGERIRKEHDARLEREAAEQDAIARMLRADVESYRPLRRTP